MNLLPTRHLTTALTCLLLTCGAFAAGPSPFFPMDTALRGGQTRSPVDQAALVKELGYDGFGTSGYPSAEFLDEAYGLERLVTRRRVVDGDVPAIARQRNRDRATNATRRAGDERNAGSSCFAASDHGNLEGRQV